MSLAGTKTRSNGTGYGSPIDRILRLLKGVKKTANGWDAICPAHDDSKPSLGVSIGSDERVLLNCRSNKCTLPAICTALNINARDLFASDHPHGKLPQIQSTFDYKDESGKLLFQVVRYVPKKFVQRRPDSKGGWIWNKNGVRCVPYRLPELLADPSAAVFIPEGEKDCETLAALGLTATTNAQGAGKWPTLDAETVRKALAGRDVFILPDNDDTGRQHAQEVAQRLQGVAKSIRVVTLPDQPDKGDVSDWLANGGDYGKLLDLCDATPLWTPSSDGEAPEQDPPKPKATFAFSWEPIGSAEFFAADYRPEWLVENAIVERQPLILGGPQKVLKTSIALDAAISVATATPAMGTFPVRTARKVAFISGESGPFALQSIGRRICAAKDIDPASLGDMLTWQFRLPQLAVQEQLDKLSDGLHRDKPAVVVIDPLYLSLLAGSDAKAENLFDTGPLLMKIAQICDEAGATPWMLHHAPKPVARKTEPMELTDLAFSGTAEFARQWILISRREPYESGSGLHELWLVIGGSVGHNGFYAVDIDEGQLGVDFGGRKWEVSVSTGTEAKKAERGEQEAAKREAVLKRDGADDLAIMGAIDREGKGEPVSYTRVRALAGLNNDRMTRSVDRLKRTGLLVEEPCTVASGNKAKTPARGLRRKGERQNVGTEAQNPDVPALDERQDGTACLVEAVPSPVVTSAESDESEDGKAVPTLDVEFV